MQNTRTCNLFSKEKSSCDQQSRESLSSPHSPKTSQRSPQHQQPDGKDGSRSPRPAPPGLDSRSPDGAKCTAVHGVRAGHIASASSSLPRATTIHVHLRSQSSRPHNTGQNSPSASTRRSPNSVSGKTRGLPNCSRARQPATPRNWGAGPAGYGPQAGALTAEWHVGRKAQGHPAVV